MTQIYFNGALHEVTESGSFFENAEGWKVSKEDCIVIDPTDPWKNFTTSVELKDIPAEAKYVAQNAHGVIWTYIDVPYIVDSVHGWRSAYRKEMRRSKVYTKFFEAQLNGNWRKAFTTVEAIRQFEESKKVIRTTSTYNHYDPSCSYIEQVRHDPTAFKVGDRVRVVRKAKDGEGGWEAYWNCEMYNYIGETCHITENVGVHGYKLNNWFNFPSFVLELVEEKSYKVSELRKMTLEQLVDLLK